MKKVKFEIEKKQFQQIIKAHSNYIYKFEGDHVLNSIATKIKNKSLILTSTDGNRALKSEITNLQLEEDIKQVNLNGFFLAKIKIIKGINISNSCPDWLEITLSKEGMDILDIANKISYKIPTIVGKFPNVEKFIKKPRSKQIFTLNVSYLKDLQNLSINERTNHIDLTFNKKNNLTPVVVEAFDGENIKTTSIIMPVQKR